MENRAEFIERHIGQIQNVTILTRFSNENEFVTGRIELFTEGCKLEFGVLICPAYPFKQQGSESIEFVNLEYCDFDHVMGNGRICIHSTHNPNLEEKIKIDINSLFEWVYEFYLKGNDISNKSYEHLILPIANSSQRRTFLFTDISEGFTRGEFGKFDYSRLPDGCMGQIGMETSIVQSFTPLLSSKWCDWNTTYKKLPTSYGFYYFIQDPPSTKGSKFGFEKWSQLTELVSQEFYSYVQCTREMDMELCSRHNIPLFIGYEIPSGHIHWEVAFLISQAWPIIGSLVKDKYVYEFHEGHISWGCTTNCSYDLFFGRGALHRNLTGSNILILGLGAIGSMVATTLTRGGCQRIGIWDYDVKEPENICRSEFQFLTGNTGKVTDLNVVLNSISPFVEVTIDKQFEMINSVASIDFYKALFEKHLSSYDYVFNCTADHDVSYILSSLESECTVFDLSITNHAKEFICATGHDFYRWQLEMLRQSNQDEVDLFQPTGCWSATFKANYNDIAVLVQFALKHINTCMKNERKIRNFHLKTSEVDGYQIELLEW